MGSIMLTVLFDRDNKQAGTPRLRNQNRFCAPLKPKRFQSRAPQKIEIYRDLTR